MTRLNWTTLAVLISILAHLASTNPIETITADEDTATALSASYRLDKTVLPLNYLIDLKLEEDFTATKKFAATKVVIALNVVTDGVQEFRLHFALEDNLSDANVMLKDSLGAKVEITTTVDAKAEQLTIKMNTGALKKAKYELTFTDLVGSFREDMLGFYLSEYYTPEKVKKFAAATQLQNTNARSIFPCFDEPAFKAEFTLSITKPIVYSVTLSNTAGTTSPIAFSKLDKITFKKTATMSSYLIAIVVSEFKYSEYSEDVRIFYPEGFEDAAEYAMKITPIVMDKLAQVTGIAYKDLGIEQMYQAAIPDFSAGAMENWGLALYRERGLLWDKTQSNRKSKQYVNTIVSHEISHMWFGDYVTMEWWSELWLNEGFATLMEYKIAALVEPSWAMMDHYIVDVLQAVFQVDAILSSQPMTSPVNSDAEISAKFGSVSYSKAGSILRMIEHFMTEERFLKAVNYYLKTNALKTTLPDDLWTALQTEANNLPKGVTVKQAMEPWTTNAGFPLLTVTRKDNDAIISQKRFLVTDGTDNTKWFVPVTYSTGNANTDFKNTQAKNWLLPTENLKIENAFKDTDWIILNTQQNGFYRVDYEEDLWSEISSLLREKNFGAIPIINRAQIIDDVMNIARVQKKKYSTALDITKYLENEIEYLPWAAAFNSLSYLRKRVSTSDELYELLTDYILKISNKLYESVKFSVDPKDSQVLVIKTALTLTWSCELGVEECTKKAQELYKDYKTTGVNKVEPNLRGVVYCNGIRHGGKAEWDFLWSEYAKTKLSTEQVAILAALGCSKNKEILNSYLSKSLTTSSGIRTQDANAVFTAVLNGNPSNVDVAFAFMTENFAAIRQAYGGMGALNKVIEGIADRVTTAKQVTDFKKFIEENKDTLGQSAETATNAVKTAEVNIKWVTEYREEILVWLRRERDSAGLAGVSFITLLITAAVVLFY